MFRICGDKKIDSCKAIYLFLIMKVKRDVNETLGHNRKQLKNLDEYVPNCW